MTDPIADLAKEIRELNTKVGDLGKEVTDLGKHVHEQLTDHGAWISEAAPKLDDTAACVAQLRDAVADQIDKLTELDKLVTQLIEEPPGPAFPPICWPTMPHDRAVKTWAALREWLVDVFVPRFSPTREQLPDCWPLHGAALDVVSWLYTTWNVAYLARSGATAAAEWHTRWLRDGLQRIPESIQTDATTGGFTRCAIGVHFDQALNGTPPTRPWTPPVDGAAPAAAWGPGSPPINGGETSEDFRKKPEHRLAEPRWWLPQFERAMADDLATRKQAEEKRKLAETPA